MGDLPADRGCCADLVIRALRLLGQDLQKEVHEDVLERPQLYNIKKPDTNIDHRRVYDLWYFFKNNFTRAASKSRKKSIELGESGEYVDVSNYWQEEKILILDPYTYAKYYKKVMQTYLPGDIIVYNLEGRDKVERCVGCMHIAIVSDVIGDSGFPCILHQMGFGQVIEDELFDYTIVGHFRYYGCCEKGSPSGGYLTFLEALTNLRGEAILDKPSEWYSYYKQ